MGDEKKGTKIFVIRKGEQKEIFSHRNGGGVHKRFLILCQSVVFTFLVLFLL